MNKNDKEAVYVREGATPKVRSLDDLTRCAGQWMTMKERGRSMVEMIGVLVVIGVLSAGALAGFNKAMKRHKTNQLISDLETMVEGLSEYKDEFGKQGNGKFQWKKRILFGFNHGIRQT